MRGSHSKVIAPAAARFHDCPDVQAFSCGLYRCQSHAQSRGSVSSRCCLGRLDVDYQPGRTWSRIFDTKQILVFASTSMPASRELLTPATEV